MNLVANKPSKVFRRNLTLVLPSCPVLYLQLMCCMTQIAKVLQNLSNAQQFQKELFMIPLNPYVNANTNRLHEYFWKLAAVDDLAEALQIDKYLEHTNIRANSINISFNQIFLIQRLLTEHLEVLVIVVMLSSHVLTLLLRRVPTILSAAF